MKTETEVMWIAERYLPLAKQLYSKVKSEGYTGIRMDIGADGTMSLSVYEPMIVGYKEKHTSYDFKTDEFYDIYSSKICAEAG